MQERVRVYTLVDISESSALQMQNYNALIQTIQLRSNVENVGSTLNGNQDLTRYNFGTNFGGEQNVWILDFTTEHTDIFSNINGEFGGLIEDIHNVPVIVKLMESAKIDPAVFDAENTKTKNIYFGRGRSIGNFKS